MIERFQDNLKDKLIEYQGRKLYVVDQILYQGNYYVYVFNAEKYEKEDALEINILKKLNNGDLEVVTDKATFKAVLNMAGMNQIANTIENFKK